MLTPIAWRKRTNPKNEISTWKDRNARVGWHSNEQSTSDPDIYKSLPSSRDELVALILEKGNDNHVLLVHDVLQPLKFLAKPPKEKELSTDLYIMF
jgi:hypothetical protein